MGDGCQSDVQSELQMLVSFSGKIAISLCVAGLELFSTVSGGLTRQKWDGGCLPSFRAPLLLPPYDKTRDGLTLTLFFSCSFKDTVATNTLLPAQWCL